MTDHRFTLDFGTLHLVLASIATGCLGASMLLYCLLWVDVGVGGLIAGSILTQGWLGAVGLVGLVLAGLLWLTPNPAPRRGKAVAFAAAIALIGALGITYTGWRNAHFSVWDGAILHEALATKHVYMQRYLSADDQKEACEHITSALTYRLAEVGSAAAAYMMRFPLDAAYEVGCIDDYDLVARTAELRDRARSMHPVASAVNLFGLPDVTEMMHVTRRHLCFLHAKRNRSIGSEGLAACEAESLGPLAPCRRAGRDQVDRRVCDLPA